MAWEKCGDGTYKFDPPSQEETFGEGGIEQAKHYVWQQLSMLATHPELDGRLFQRFAGAIMAECISVDEPGDVDLKQGGLKPNDICELNQLGFLNGYRGDEGHTRSYTVAAYRRQLVRVDHEAEWKVALPPPLGSIH